MPPDKSLYTSTSSNQNFADTDKKSVQIIISLTLFGKCLANIPASGFLASLSSSNCTFNSQIWPRLPKALNSIYAPSLMSRSTLKITLNITFLFLDFQLEALGARGSTGLRLSVFAQISELFQFQITDFSRQSESFAKSDILNKKRLDSFVVK